MPPTSFPPEIGEGLSELDKSSAAVEAAEAVTSQLCQHQVSIRCADCGQPAFAVPCRHERVIVACSKCGVNLAIGASPAFFPQVQSRPEGSENGDTGP